MSSSKKWMGLAALGTAVAALFNRMRNRGDNNATPAKETGSGDT